MGITPYYDVTLKEARHAILRQSNAFTHSTACCEDQEALKRAADSPKPEVILHLAAQAGVRYGLENPKAYIDSNLTGSWNVLELARQVKPKHLLLASSSSIYGANEKIPFEETDRANQPLSLYAATRKGDGAYGSCPIAHLHAVTHHRLPVFYGLMAPGGVLTWLLFRFTDAILHDRPIDIYGEGRMERRLHLC